MQARCRLALTQLTSPKETNRDSDWLAIANLSFKQLNLDRL
jgi:hypothetical protein